MAKLDNYGDVLMFIEGWVNQHLPVWGEPCDYQNKMFAIKRRKIKSLVLTVTSKLLVIAATNFGYFSKKPPNC